MTAAAGRISAVALTAAIAATAGQASAGGFALKERSARAQGVSFAGVSAGSGGIASMGFNPAAIGVVDQGGAVAGGVSLVMPIADGKVFDAAGAPTGESVDADRAGALANGYFGYRFAPDLLFGAAIYTPFGLATGYEPTFSGGADALTSNLQTFVFAPTIAWEPVPELTLAASLNVFYANGRLTRGTNQGAGVLGLNLDGDDTTAGFSVGALWQPVDGTSIGLAYQHGYGLDLSGFAQTPVVAGVNLPVTAKIRLPATASLGIVQQITDRVRVMGEVQWQNWSVFDAIDISIPALGQAGTARDPQNYKDAFFVALGGEFDVTDALTVRAGAAWDQTPTQDSNFAAGFFGRTVRVPDEDRIWLSLGASYDLTDSVSFDAGYSYLFAIDDPVVALRTVPGSTVRYDAGAHIFSVGASMRF